MSDNLIQEQIKQDYAYGFVTDVESVRAPKGLNKEVIQFISKQKKEPQWLLEWRLKAFERLQTMTEPNWQKPQYPKIDYQALYYYSAPKGFKEGPKSLDEIDPEIKIFGEDTDRLGNTCYFAYPSMTSENQVIALDQKGICVSSGAACSSGKVEPSHVLKAMNVDEKYIHSAIRVSLGWDSTKEQIETFFSVWKSDCFKNGALNVR